MDKKRIVCFGDSNTWGYDAKDGERFPESVRWTKELQRKIGEEYEIIEEGLCGRTTVFEDPLQIGRRGIDYLIPCLQSHKRISGLIIMLGTNDCKERFSATAENIGKGMKRLVSEALSLAVWKKKAYILVVSPPPIRKECESSSMKGEMGICSEKSRGLRESFAICAKECECDFLDAGTVASMNEIDYMHLTQEGHKALGEAIFQKIGDEKL